MIGTMPGAFAAAAALTVLLAAPLLKTCTEAVPEIPAGTWKFTWLEEMKYKAAGNPFTLTEVPLSAVGRLLPRPAKSAVFQIRVVAARLAPFTWAHEPGTRPPATYVAPFATDPDVSAGPGEPVVIVNALAENWRPGAGVPAPWQPHR